MPIVLCLLSQAPPGFARDTPDPDWFAICTGRLSALMEMQFLIDGPASEATRLRRDAMADLLAAVASPQDGARLMGLRVDAKWAFRALLEQAAFGPDPGHRAERAARAMAASCSGMLLG